MSGKYLELLPLVLLLCPSGDTQHGSCVPAEGEQDGGWEWRNFVPASSTSSPLQHSKLSGGM